MRYKPNFCSNCAEPVERYSWKLWTSTRFCENCESEFRFADWFPTVTMFLSVLFGLFGFGSYLKSPDKPLSIANNTFAAVSSNRNSIEKNSNAPKSVNQTVISNANSANQNQVKVSSTPPKSANLVEIKQNEAAETVYFCGAQTKKGSPCTRKVKSADRCWQHAGQPAILPKEKLVASQ